jgi:hypothetical protein
LVLFITLTCVFFILNGLVDIHWTICHSLGSHILFSTPSKILLPPALSLCHLNMVYRSNLACLVSQIIGMDGAAHKFWNGIAYVLPNEIPLPVGWSGSF